MCLTFMCLFSIITAAAAQERSPGKISSEGLGGKNIADIFAPASPANLPSRYVFTLAAPFLTATDSVAFADLSDFWVNGPRTEAGLPVKQLYILSGTETLLENIFQFPASSAIKAVSESELLSQVYTDETWAILPFESLEPRYKSIQLDGMSALSNIFDINHWPLTAHIGGSPEMSDADWQQIPASNRDPGKLTTLMLTGVTALVRGTASYMDVWGPEYPAKNIRDTLRAVDLLHVNNEVPFAAVCQQTEAELNRLQFCSKTAYIDLLTDIGTDLVELDGDHFQDFGDEAVYKTLDLYREKGIPAYGGGKNLEEARKPLLLEHNGNRFAFIGCNGKEIGYASASETRPGAAHCDIPWITKQIKTLKAEGYLPIVTFQHIEYYNVSPNDEMREDFTAAADAGAVVVSGSQSHIPMAFEISENSFIHYGLGNLFFDQAFFLPETSEATLDVHVFYDGRHIGTELLTIKFTNLALNRFMTEPERHSVLERIFSKSIVGVE